jgi:hypothetical protein
VYHADRTICIKVMDSEDDPIEVLTNHKWSFCRAFGNEGLLYLNDDIAKMFQYMQLRR